MNVLTIRNIRRVNTQGKFPLQMKTISSGSVYFALLSQAVATSKTTFPACRHQ